jgi:hypothetical protein
MVDMMAASMTREIAMESLVLDGVHTFVPPVMHDDWNTSPGTSKRFRNFSKMPDGARLSKLLFEARELIDMLQDQIEVRSGRPSTFTRRVRDDIDLYRAEQGWSPHGFGGEEEAAPRSSELEGLSESDRKRVIWSILIDECGATENQWNEFYLHWPQCQEFRFQGDLGFGGKVLNFNDRVWVNCYPEDLTVERRTAINRANARLSGG